MFDFELNQACQPASQPSIYLSLLSNAITLALLDDDDDDDDDKKTIFHAKLKLKLLPPTNLNLLTKESWWQH